MTDTQIKEAVKVAAEDLDIQQYKAAMLELLKCQSEIKSLESKKEKLKKQIKAALEKNKDRATFTPIPDSEKVAVAYFATSMMPKWNHDVAHALLDAELLGRFHTHVPQVSFSVVEMDRLAAEDLVNKSNSPEPSAA